MALIEKLKLNSGLSVLAKQSAFEILLYGDIGGSGFDSISAKQFSEALKSIPQNAALEIRINSSGGSVFDGMTIYERIRGHKGKKKVFIDGLAASIASVIAMSGDEITMGEGAVMMLHKPWNMIVGNADEMLRMVEVLDKIEGQMVGIYARKTGLGRTEIESMLREETWFNSTEALSKNFVDAQAALDERFLVAASLQLDSAKGFKFKPKLSRTETEIVRSKIDEFKAKVEGFISRK